MDLLSALVASSKRIANPQVAAYASGNRIFTVRITRPVAKVSFSRADRQFTNPEDDLVYAGPARIWPVSGTATVTFEDEGVDISSIRASIDDTAAGDVLRQGDHLEVMETDESTAGHLAGKHYVVDDVEIGGHYAYGWHFTATGFAKGSVE